MHARTHARTHGSCPTLVYTTTHYHQPTLVAITHHSTPTLTLTLTSLITGCRSARDLTQTDILSKSSNVIGSFGMPDLPKWMMLDIISITSAANICGWMREGEGGWSEGWGVPTHDKTHITS